MLFAPVSGGPAELTQSRAALLGSSLGLPEGRDSLEIAGRAFTLTEVYDAPHHNAEGIGYLLPDSVDAIVGLSDDGWWYQISPGDYKADACYVPREALQPVAPYRLAENYSADDHTGYYEVVAPLLSIREFCAGHATVLARLGYGAVVYVHDGLTDDAGQAWRAVTVTESGAGFFGWLGAALIRPVQTGIAPRLSAPMIWIDSATSRLSVYDGDRFIGESAMYSEPLVRGAAALNASAPAAWVPEPPFARPWTMTLDSPLSGPIPVNGAFWHNKFGGGRAKVGIDLPIIAARWLYDMVSQSAARSVPVVVE